VEEPSLEQVYPEGLQPMKRTGIGCRRSVKRKEQRKTVMD